jgi:integrase
MLSFVDWCGARTTAATSVRCFRCSMYRDRLKDMHRMYEILRSLGIGRLGADQDGKPIYDRRKANHSWRHTVRTRWREVDPVTGEHYIPNEGVADKMCGHASGSVGREYGYFPMPTLKASIYNVPAWEL